VYYTNWVDRMWEEKTFQGFTPECEPIPERLIAPSGLWINTDDPLAQLLGWAIEEGWENECQDGDSDEERPLCKDCEIETKKYCDVCGGYGDSDEDW